MKKQKQLKDCFLNKEIKVMLMLGVTLFSYFVKRLCFSHSVTAKWFKVLAPFATPHPFYVDSHDLHWMVIEVHVTNISDLVI